MHQILQKHQLVKPEGPVIIVILDGVGIGRQDEGDAVHLARTPTLDWLDEQALKIKLLAHGTHIGMPCDKDMGNSEVGHNALGAGKIYDQGAKLVDHAIQSGALFDRSNSVSKTWADLIDHTLEHQSTLHLIGLLSDGNIHSNIEHIEQLARDAHRQGVSVLRLHILLDGRDVGGQSALVYINRIESCFLALNKKNADYQIASGGGRMLITMDRYEADWPMVERGWRTHVLAQAPPFPSASSAVEAARASDPDLNDQFLPAFIITDSSNNPVGEIRDNDGVLLFNFRGDRAIELTQAFEDKDFSHFDRVRSPDVFFAGMMQYDGDLGLPSRYLITPPSISGTMGERLAAAGVKQLAVSETQKFGHVTYFWNGNRSAPFSPELERYIEVPSDRVVFDQRPWMKGAEITDETIQALLDDPEIRFARINYPNGDMVGHTGQIEATILAIESTDLCLARLLLAIKKMGGAALITADHGNADQMFQIDKKTGAFLRDDQGRTVPMTAHTLNPVPLWIYTPGLDDVFSLTEVEHPRLSNVASTALLLLGFQPPADMDHPLLKHR